MNTKVCKKCGEEYPLSEYYKQKVQKDGLDVYHKDCRKAVTREYYQNNKEKAAEYQREYYKRKKEGKK